VSLQVIRDRRHAVEAVRNVVSAMRATAAGRIQAAQRAMAAARQYREVVIRGLAAAGPAALTLVPQSGGGTVLFIVLTSEQPLCGEFNHAVVDHALKARRERLASSKVQVVAVGRRGSRVMVARGLAPDHTEPGPTSLTGLRDLVRRLSARTDHGYTTGAVVAVDVVYARYRSVSEQVPIVERVLPIDPSVVPPVRTASPFCRYLPDPQLAAGLVGQFAYISLYRAAAESYASEQGSRLVAMDGATRNTGRMVDEMTGLEHRGRQQEITRQMLELTASRLTGEGG
jgi:F-type H+-transporting ATPase subunit gamma